MVDTAESYPHRKLPSILQAREAYKPPYIDEGLHSIVVEAGPQIVEKFFITLIILMTLRVYLLGW